MESTEILRWLETPFKVDDFISQNDQIYASNYPL